MRCASTRTRGPGAIFSSLSSSVGFDDEAYEREKEETHARMRRIGRVIRLEGRQFKSPYDGLERQLQRIAGQIARDLRWRWMLIGA